MAVVVRPMACSHVNTKRIEIFLQCCRMKKEGYKQERKYDRGEQVITDSVST